MSGRYDALKSGAIQRSITVTQDVGYGDVAFEKVDDVSALTRELVNAYNIAVKDLEEVRKALSDLKTRKWWDEVEVFTDRASMNQVVVRTHYQLEMKTMRMEVSPEQFRMMR